MAVAASWASDPTQMALVVVDVQNDFAHPDGSVYVDGGQEVIPPVNEEVAAARGSGALVVYTQDWHPERTPHFENDGGAWPPHCIQRTWGGAFHDALEIAGPVVQKGTGGEDGYSGFTVQVPHGEQEQPTRLDALLKEHNIAKLVVVGLAQDQCVQETVLDAIRLGYQVSVRTDATRAVNLQTGDGDAALRSMAAAGAELLDWPAQLTDTENPEPVPHTAPSGTHPHSGHPAQDSRGTVSPQRPDLQDMPTEAQHSPATKTNVTEQQDPAEHEEPKPTSDQSHIGEEPPD